MNNVNLIGRITQDLELKQTTNGMSVLNFTVAVNKDKETAYFIDCVAFKTIAQNICRYLKKGSQIGINGILTTRMNEYNGQKRKYTEVVINTFDFIGSKADNGNDGYQAPSFNPTATPKFEELANDDTLPF